MSLKRDKVTAWARANGDAIANHRSQPLPKSSGGPFGGSVFGLATRTLGITAPSLLGRLSPTDLFDGQALVNAGKDYLFSKAGAAINQALSPQNRKWLEGQNHSNLLGATTGYRLNHKLENRGYLQFRFPNNAINPSFLKAGIEDRVFVEGEDAPFETFSLPFFENPKISESRSAEYASHKIVNRNEPYRLWTGAKPLKVNLNFNITLPNLLTFAELQMKECIKFQLKSQEFKDALLEFIGERLPTPFGGASFGSNDLYEVTNSILTDMNDPKGLGSSDNHRSRLILYSMYLINLIRASVIGSSNSALESESSNSSENAAAPFVQTYLPAPVIFLTYGGIYENSPFIATNYSITFDGKSGYEELSLLPRVIQVKLTLESYNQFKDSDKIFGIPKLFGYKQAQQAENSAENTLNVM